MFVKFVIIAHRKTQIGACQYQYQYQYTTMIGGLTTILPRRDRLTNLIVRKFITIVNKVNKLTIFLKITPFWILLMITQSVMSLKEI